MSFRISKKTFFPCLLFVCLSLLFVGCGKAPHQEFAPEFRLPSYEDPAKEEALSELVGNSPVLLIFWASWCPACVEEIPILNDWHKQYAPEQLRILGINVQESPEKIQEFLKRHPIEYPILLDRQGEVLERYGFSGLPGAVLLAKNGKITYYGFSLPKNLGELLRQGEMR